MIKMMMMIKMVMMILERMGMIKMMMMMIKIMMIILERIRMMQDYPRKLPCLGHTKWALIENQDASAKPSKM